ncbi:hypothetical protein DdX_08515 [Ditylenchus destructor]|uniref:Uncharacterized protein n=1 Tax=Ditylenchus destructor TaxID=166010 RepID=A0AAD4N4B1_9BILA|nr:hypothetical protein DdX_08515 [Ditylenchus destructor]
MKRLVFTILLLITNTELLIEATIAELGAAVNSIFGIKNDQQSDGLQSPDAEFHFNFPDPPDELASLQPGEFDKAIEHNNYNFGDKQNGQQQGQQYEPYRHQNGQEQYGGTILMGNTIINMVVVEFPRHCFKRKSISFLKNVIKLVTELDCFLIYKDLRGAIFYIPNWALDF